MNLCDDHAWCGTGECPECKANDDVFFGTARDEPSDKETR